MFFQKSPHKYVHIDMTLNFMHILAELGFGGIPLYIGTKKGSMP